MLSVVNYAFFRLPAKHIIYNVFGKWTVIKTNHVDDSNNEILTPSSLPTDQHRVCGER